MDLVDDFSVSVSWVKRKSYRDKRTEWAWNGWPSHCREKRMCLRQGGVKQQHLTMVGWF